MKTHAIFAVAGVTAALVGSSAASAAVIVNETFESYADAAAMNAVWVPAVSGGVATLQTSGGNPGQYAFNPGNAANPNNLNQQQLSSSYNATAAENLVLSFSFLEGNPASANHRETVGLRNSAGANLIEIGAYNQPNQTPYVIRTALFASGNDGYVTFKNSSGTAIGAVPGWHTFAATISTTGIVFTLDLQSDGTIDSTITSSAVATAAGFNNIRFGGPSGAPSAVGAGFDNILLQTVPVPEPTALAALGGIAGLAIARRRKAL